MIRVCRRCGNVVIESECDRADENGKKYYVYQCLNCDEDLFEFETEIIPCINIADIIFALDNYKIIVWQDAEDDSAKCKIGDYWFYFTHIEDDTCLESFSTDELAEMILNVINEPEHNGLGIAEANYYKCIINEIVQNTK